LVSDYISRSPAGNASAIGLTIDRSVEESMRDIPLRSLLRIEEARDAQICDFIGPGRVIALGESFHHSHELLVTRARLVQALVRSGGVRRILLEAVRPGPGPISDYLSGKRIDGGRALREPGARMWQNHESLRLLGWLRAFNLDHRHDPVTIEGIDILAPGTSMRAMAEHLDPDEAERIIAFSHAFDHDGRADQIAYNGLTGAERAWLGGCFERLGKRLSAENEGDRVVGAIADLRQNCRIALQSLHMLEAGAGGWINGFAHRDRALAENAEQAINGVDGRTLILAHNMHVNASAWHQPEGPHPITPMGAFMRQRLGSDYVVVGTSFGSASFDPPIYGISSLSAAGTGTIDETLDRRATGPTLVDLGSLGRIDEMGMMGLDLHGAPYLTYPGFSDAFDLLLHVPEIRNAEPLFETGLDLDIAAVDRSRSAGSDHPFEASG
jgi:erythromycin esterase